MVDQIEKGVGISRDHAGVAQGNRQFFGRGVLGLDDLFQPVAVRDQTPIPTGFSGAESQNHDIRAIAPGGLHRLQRFGADERRIAVKHDNIAIEPVQCSAGLRHRMRGSQLFGLTHDDGVCVMNANHRRHPVAAVARDDDSAVR